MSEADQPDRMFNVLFLCTDNSARSILAESILTKDGASRFRAFSAGSQPKSEVGSFALKVLKSLASLRTKLVKIGQSDDASSPRNSAA
ncbi:Low molecular weight phosphotyrosine protein phosphatase [Nitrobacter sp. Nb-311A]|nr:Low molecular weight phosphotyrosine protein phosphatase [Nitrobacter sp. Nb-311A]MCB1394124.1 hypothetical protein [Nitrobacter sp.]